MGNSQFEVLSDDDFVELLKDEKFVECLIESLKQVLEEEENQD